MLKLLFGGSSVHYVNLDIKICKNKRTFHCIISDHKRLLPKSFPEADICSSFSKDYMFLGCIQFIHKVLKNIK